VRPVEDGQAVRLLFEVPPVRVRFGNVAADNEVVSRFQYERRQVRGERALFGRRDQDRERIRLHERDRVSMVGHAEMFRNVHKYFLSPLQGLINDMLRLPTAYAVG
jgi:hypothetical protein